MAINKQLFAIILCAAPPLVGASSPLTWTQRQEITTPNSLAFGCSVALSGDTAIVTDCLKNVGENTGQGAAYVYVRSAGKWTRHQRLTASNGNKHQRFGSAVALSGNTAVISAEPGNYQGSVYVFVNNDGNWVQQQELTASDVTPTDGFGVSLSIDGDTVVVGADNKTVDSHVGEGAAYVFVRNAGVWSQQQELNENGAKDDYFGNTVSLSGDTVLIGAPGTSKFNHDQGAAYVFVRNGDIWTKQQQLTAPDGAAKDWFGGSLSLSGDTALIGADTKTVGSNAFQGAAYAFVRGGGVWTLQQELTAADGAANDDFGIVAVSGNTAVIGAPTQKDGNTFPQGAAYVFIRKSGIWTQTQELHVDPSLNGPADFGAGVALDGSTVLIGDDGLDNHGAAYVFVN